MPKPPSIRLSSALAVVKLLSLAVLLGLYGCHSEEKKAEKGPPEPKVEGETVQFAADAPQLASISVQTTEPRRVAITHVSGRLYWDDDTTVRIFIPVLGRVTSVLKDIGAPVSPREALAEVDSPDFAQALADARTALGNLMAAEKALTRTKSLLDHGAAALKELEAAQAAYISTLAERDRAAARLNNYGGSDLPATELERSAGDRLEAKIASFAGNDPAKNARYILRTPLSGIVVDKSINPGQEVRPDMMLANVGPITNPLFTVSDPTTLWLQVDVAESDLPSLQIGLPLKIMCKAFPNKTFDGVITKIGDTMDPATRTVKVRGVVNNPDTLLKAEMYVIVNVLEDVAKLAKAGVDVPSTALFMKKEESFLFIEESPGQYRRQKVKVGVEQDNKVTVYEGLKAGQKVVTEGALLLQVVVEPAG